MSVPTIIGGNRVVLLGSRADVRASAAEFRHAGITVFTRTDLISALLEIAHDRDSVFVVSSSFHGIELGELLHIATATCRDAVILGTSPGDDPRVFRIAAAAGIRATVPLPLTPEELAHAIAGLPERSDAAEDVLTVGDLVVDAGAHRVLLAGEPIDLTLREFSILHTLVRVHPRIATLDELAAVYRGSAVDPPAAIRVAVGRIRARMTRSEESARTSIETVRGVGYRLAC